MQIQIPQTGYRREVDGLRAVAVLPVAFFHAGFDYFSGGFVGVDVFFVISGYLITLLILKELATGTFSLISFYERRARRILPALFLVLLACLPAAYAWMMPHELIAFAKSLHAVALGVSNFYFNAASGYFDQAVELKPLIHTWSLSAEEQFYLVFPIAFLFLHRRFKTRLISILALSLVASLLLAQLGGNAFGLRPWQHWSWQNPPSWGFYLLPTRAWELLIGSVLAVVEHDGRLAIAVRNQVLKQIASVLGLLLISVSVLAFDQNTPFPGVYALLPALGAALVLAFAREGTIVWWLLTRPVLVGIGLISYSFYLWHQPLFAFARIRSFNEPSDEVFLGLIIVSLALAYVTWRFVERPFREKSFLRSYTVVRAAICASAFFIAVSWVGLFTKGLPERLSSEALAFLDAAQKGKQCSFYKTMKPCVYGKGRPIVALIGDSHARALTPELARAFHDKDIAVQDFHIHGCPPVRGGEEAILRCRLQDRVLDTLLSSNEIETVIVVSRWAAWFEQSKFDNGEGGVERKGPIFRRHWKAEELRGAIAETVKSLLSKGKKVVLVDPIPAVGWDLPNYMAKEAFYGRLKDDVSTSYSVFVSRTQRARASLNSIGEHPNLVRIRPEEVLCNTNGKKGRCLASKGMVPLYSDDDHLNSVGASLVVSQIMKVL